MAPELTGYPVTAPVSGGGDPLWHKPEGRALPIPDTSNTAVCRLVMGFASENSYTDPDKMARFYYKSSLI
ncbi:hypothetical protein ACFY1U_49230 [Streptomyces sp. NPDC001351]|uniref:hypothetical protein n=1 Tax=Streptomyces sp. NPDC001351 TaxID=3364564 RepID=UPI0036872BC0